MSRSESLQAFVDAAQVAFEKFAADDQSRHVVAQIFASLKLPRPQRLTAGRRLPVCALLDRALTLDTNEPSLLDVAETFKSIEPMLEWRRRPTFDGSASSNFVDGHANVMIVGPGGVEDRRDLWLGASLMAPNVRYPDHEHGPEEIYLVLSKGEFWRDGGDWFTPGIGGSFYNRPSIKHAMRSSDVPLFALWALRTGHPADAPAIS